MDIAAWIVISVGLGTVMVAGWQVDKGQRATDSPDADEPETHAQLPSTVAARAAPRQVGPRGEDFYSPLPATCVLVAPPYVESLAGEVTLQEWLRHCHPERNHVWADVVTQFYTRAAAAPTVAGYFVGVDMDALQRHFLAALMMVTGHGLTVGAVRQMRTKHADVRNPRGEPITEAVYDAATGVLVDVLREMTVPEPTLRQLQVTLAPLREVIAVHPDTDNAGGQRRPAPTGTAATRARRTRSGSAVAAAPRTPRKQRWTLAPPPISTRSPQRRSPTASAPAGHARRRGCAGTAGQRHTRRRPGCHP